MKMNALSEIYALKTYGKQRGFDKRKVNLEHVGE